MLRRQLVRYTNAGVHCETRQHPHHRRCDRLTLIPEPHSLGRKRLDAKVDPKRSGHLGCAKIPQRKQEVIVESQPVGEGEKKQVGSRPIAYRKARIRLALFSQRPTRSGSGTASQSRRSGQRSMKARWYFRRRRRKLGSIGSRSKNAAYSSSLQCNGMLRGSGRHSAAARTALLPAILMMMTVPPLVA
jgi:hypothetical protein